MRIEPEKVLVKGKEILFRNAEEDDAQILIDCLKTVCGETRFLVKEPEEITMTLEQEKDFINAQNDSEHNLMLLGFLNGEYVGNCSLIGNRRAGTNTASAWELRFIRSIPAWESDAQ